MEAGKGKSKKEENSEDAFAVRLFKRINVATDIFVWTKFTPHESTRDKNAHVLISFFTLDTVVNTRPFLALSVLNIGATLCNKVHCAL